MKVFILFLSLSLVRVCATDYWETFDGLAGLADMNSAGWTLITDTAAPTALGTSFASDDDVNIAMITRANGATSLFTSAYFYHEHDIAAGESVLQGNLSGQDAGDFMLTTNEPATIYGAQGMDVLGATFSVDYQHGTPTAARPVFWFVIVLADGSRWTVGDGITTTGSDTMRSVSSDPIGASTEFRRILSAGGIPGQKLRLESSPSTLTPAQLMDVRAVGLYARPGTEGSPSRFDNFQLQDYTLQLASVATITHIRTGSLSIDDADPGAFQQYLDTSVPKFSPQTGQLTSIQITMSGAWSGSYTFQNDAAGAAGRAHYTPHPYLWTQTRLPDSWSFFAESTGPAQLQEFGAGDTGTATDSASGTLSNSVTVPTSQISKFEGTGTTILDLEIRDDSSCENLSSTTESGLFQKSMRADVTLTLTYTYTPAPTGDGVIFVKHDATGANDGSTWVDAFTDLQFAIAAARPGNTIWVAEGTYRPVPIGGDRATSFEMRGGVSWYGGFTGSETSLDQRDPSAHPTILSGDLNGDDGGGTGVNAQWYHMGENSYLVVRASNLLLPACIDGFTLTRGSASSSFSGSGISVISCKDLRIANCRIIDNISPSAAGLLTIASHTTLLSCQFENNYAYGGRGGAIYHTADWQDPTSTYLLTIHDSTFVRNRATVGGGPGDAGAIWSSFRAPVDVDRCLFENNRAEWRFTYGNFAAGGGAMLIFGEGSRIANSIFRNNRAHVGGAIWLGRASTVLNCLFVNNVAFRQSQGIYDYGGYAGAIYAPGSASSASSQIDHCTFHANLARNVGGIWGNPSLLITNSILYTNISTEVEATLLDQQLAGKPIIRHSCVKGLTVLENGNINFDPIFVDQDGADNVLGNVDDDLHLNRGSPCIDSGDNNAFPPGNPALDFDGASRFLDDPLSADTGSGSAPITDMGIYEFIPGSGTGGGNSFPMASFTHLIGIANRVNFTDTSTDSDGNILQWIWNFGDGTSSTEQDPTHVYAANGSYNVTLVVRDNLNGTNRSSVHTIILSGLASGSVSISSPDSNATVDGLVQIEATTTPDIIRVKLYVDGAYVALKDTTAPFSISWDSSTVADGLHTIQFKAIDDTDTDEGTFWTVPIVIAVQNIIPPSPMETWREAHFTAAELADGSLESTLWGPSVDPDQDGLTNDDEFSIGTNPRDPSDSTGGVSYALVNDPSGRYLVITFRRRNDDPNHGVVAQLSGDFSSWSTDRLETVSAIDQGDGYDLVTVRELPSATPRRSLFLRLQITHD